MQGFSSAILALVAVALGLGRPDLLLCRLGGLARLANARVRARRRPVGPEEPEQALPG